MAFKIPSNPNHSVVLHHHFSLSPQMLPPSIQGILWVHIKVSCMPGFVWDYTIVALWLGTEQMEPAPSSDPPGAALNEPPLCYANLAFKVCSRPFCS